MPTDAFTTHIADLRTLGGRRVWSLMISLFGDLAQAQGEAIEGPVLTSIMGVLQVKPEAVRVALHRLRNDGWITSTKSGRTSSHALTTTGHAESLAASPRIYAPVNAADNPWQLVLIEDVTTQVDDGFTAITPRIYVGAATLPAPDGALLFNGSDVPEWLCAQAEPAHLRGEYEALKNTLEALNAALPKPSDISPVEVAVLRCLIVHNWRRLVLKHPALPSALISTDWPGHHCHLLVDALLARFPRPTLIEIDQRQAA
jgi:phenylacetic acid degradation operon negative regulatory protein